MLNISAWYCLTEGSFLRCFSGSGISCLLDRLSGCTSSFCQHLGIFSWQIVGFSICERRMFSKWLYFTLSRIDVSHKLKEGRHSQHPELFGWDSGWEKWTTSKHQGVFLQGLNLRLLQKPQWQRHQQKQLHWAPALSSKGMRMNLIQRVQLPHWNLLETSCQSYHLLMPGHLCFRSYTNFLLFCLLVMTAHRKAFTNQASWQVWLGLIFKLCSLFNVWDFVGDCIRILRHLLLLS